MSALTVTAVGLLVFVLAILAAGAYVSGQVAAGLAGLLQ